MFNHYGVRMVSSLSGISTAQVRVKYNHHMAREIEAMMKDLDLGLCRCFNVHNQKDIKMTEVLLEFESSNRNWLKYSSLKTQISILQKELDIKRLKELNDSILQDVEEDVNPFIIND